MAKVVKNPNVKVEAANTQRSAAVAAAKQVKEEVLESGTVGHTKGVTTGMNVHNFWGYLLSNNEEWHATDEVLEGMFLEEFPLRGYTQPAKRMRGWYNCGTYSKTGLAPNAEHTEENGVRPDVRSNKYDETGEIAKRAPSGFAKKKVEEEVDASEEVETEEAPAPKPKVTPKVTPKVAVKPTVKPIVAAPKPAVLPKPVVRLPAKK